MTIRFLNAWNGYDDQDIATLSSAEESRLVGLGLATFDLFAEKSENRTGLNKNIILHGDSYMEYSAITASGVINQYLQSGFWSWCNPKCGGYFADVIGSGVGGENATEIKDRLPGIINANPGAGTIMIITGTNMSTSWGVAIDAIEWMIEYAKGRGLSVIISTIPPRARVASDFVAYTAYRKLLNPAIRRAAKEMDCILFDMEAVLLNPATDGIWAAGEGIYTKNLYTTVSPSGVHLSGSGAMLVGSALAQQLRPFIIPKSINTWPDRQSKTGSLGLMAGTSGSTTSLSAGSVMPTGWDRSGTVTLPAGGTTTGTIVTSLVDSVNPKFPGKLLQVKITEDTGSGLAAGLVSLFATLAPASWSIGQPLSGSVYMEADAENWGGTQNARQINNIFINCVNSGFASVGSLRIFADDINTGNFDYFKGGVINLPGKKANGDQFLIPDTTAHIQIWIVVGGIGTFRFGNFIVG